MQAKPPSSFWNGNLAQVIFWAFTFFLAAYGSLYAQEIKDFSLPTYTAFTAGEFSMNWHLCFFIVATILSVTALILIKHHGSKRQDYLYAHQLTSPPATFYQWFAEAVKDARTLEIHSEITNDPKVIEENVRTLLDYIINLTKTWDSSNIESNVVYRANVMDVTYFDEDTGFNIPTGYDARFFFEPADKLYSGLVYLKGNSLTTTTETPEPTPDKERKPIYFPFSINCGTETNTNRFTNNLKGAPTCVVTKHYSYVEDTDAIVESAKQMEPASEKIYNTLKEYYANPTNPAHSILSIPLFDVTDDMQSNGNTRTVYVLNIYRNLRGMLFHGSKVDDFVSLLSPLLVSLFNILELRQELLNEQAPNPKEVENSHE